MNKANVRSHRIMCMGVPYTLYSPLSFDHLSKLFGKDYLGEVCNVTGLLKPHVEPFIMLESISNLITGKAMYDPIFEQVFGESNLANSPVPPEQVDVAKASPCTQENCPFCPPTVSMTVEQFLRSRAMPDLYTQDGTLDRGALNDQLKLRKSVRDPTVDDYREAAAGNRPFPVPAIVPDFLADALATLHEIKGVNLKDSTTYRGVISEAKDLLNDPTAHGKAIVDSILALLGIEDTVRNLPDQVNLPEPKAKRFVVTRDPVDVFNVFKLFMTSTEAQASRDASVSRSPDVNLAIYEESVESLKRRTYIAFGDLMNLPRLPLDYIADNAEENVFNLSAKGTDFTQHICTVRYNKFEYTIEVFR